MLEFLIGGRMIAFFKFFLFSVPERAVVLLVVLNIQISYFDRLYALCDHLAEVAPLPDEIMEEIGLGLGGNKNTPTNTSSEFAPNGWIGIGIVLGCFVELIDYITVSFCLKVSSYLFLNSSKVNTWFCVP